MRSPMADAIAQQVLVFDDAHVLDRRSRTGGAATKGRDVAEIVHRIRGVVFEHVKDFLGGDHAGNRRIARGHAFGHGHEVRLDAVLLVSEPGAGSANAADNLVDMQQDVVFLADFLHALPVALGRFDYAAACGDRLKAQGANGVGAFAQDDLFDLIRGPFAKVLVPARRPVRACGIPCNAARARNPGAKGPYCAVRSS